MKTLRQFLPPLIATLAVSPAMPAQAKLDEQMRAAIARGDVPGVVVMAADRNGVIYRGAFGLAEAAAGRAMTADAIFSIASMTKAVTSVAAMQLIEAGKLSLEDRAEKHLPELAHPMVFTSFDAATGDYTLRPAASAITVRQLFTHTSGLGYGFTSAVLNKFKPRAGETQTAGPLLFDPGTQWTYGTNTDMLGKIVEKISGENLEQYFRAHILAPLGMHDTAYNLPPEKHARIVNVHRRNTAGALVEQPRNAPKDATKFNGGGGLYSTAADYLRFLQMLLNGGELGGVRLLGPKTLALMTTNHLPGGRDLPEMSRSLFSEATYNGIGFGLGFSVTMNPAQTLIPGSAGEYSWGGAATTSFWIDPAEELIAIFMTQVLPSSAYPIRRELRTMVYSAITDSNL